MIYFVLFLFFLGLSYHFDYLGKHTNKYTFYSVSLIILILLSGLRYRIGLDSIRYEGHHIETPTLFELTATIFQDSNHEPLFIILASIAKTISPEFWVLQMLQSSLVNTIFFRFIRLNTKNIFFGVLLYYVCLYINFFCEVMREACAVSMLLLGWEYLKNDKIIRFSFYCILACGFHISSILLLVIPILRISPIWYLFKINKYTVFILIGVLFVGYYIQATFFDYLNLLSLGDSYNSKVNRYTDSDLASSVLNINGIISAVCRNIFFPFLSIILLKQHRIYRICNNLEPMVLLSLIFAVFTIPIAIFYRYTNYFLPFAIIAICNFMYIPRIYLSTKKYIKLRHFGSWYIILFPMLFFQIYSFNAKEGDSQFKAYMRYYPYSSIIFENKDVKRESLFLYRNAF